LPITRPNNPYARGTNPSMSLSDNDHNGNPAHSPSNVSAPETAPATGCAHSTVAMSSLMRSILLFGWAHVTTPGRLFLALRVVLEVVVGLPLLVTGPAHPLLPTSVRLCRCRASTSKPFGNPAVCHDRTCRRLGKRLDHFWDRRNSERLH